MNKLKLKVFPLMITKVKYMEFHISDQPVHYSLFAAIKATFTRGRRNDSIWNRSV